MRDEKYPSEGDKTSRIRRRRARRLDPRRVARRFRAETGTTPLRWLHAQRIERARRLLERSELAVETVAQRCGFGSAAILRRHFRRATATTPTAYRRTFGESEYHAAAPLSLI